MAFKNPFQLKTGSSPLLRESILTNQDNLGDVIGTERMTVSGTINRSLILGFILVLTSCISYIMPNAIFMWVGVIGGLICVITAAFKTQWSPILAPLYVAFEGLFVGTVSFMYASMFNGIVFQAVSLTMAVFFLMLFLYKSGIIKVNNTFRSVIIGATGAIALVYIVSMILGFFNVQVPFIYGNGLFGIGFSVLVVGIAAFNLMLDFDFFDKGESAGLPKYMEWYAAMGLWVTLIWLYLEMLRLLSKLSSRD
ncbi:MAG: Bax inhibitor-1/YccA family protein [Saprospiraceae bacterium]|nr:Bax inhibitor-1/YccA family protein [Saprospiraceae bacterium]MCC6843480.1 Bax inhibitor-1/YccA family protein [Saprospiraceae bacterium]